MIHYLHFILKIQTETVIFMPLFPDYVIAEVVEKNDIVDVIGQTVTLKRSGSNYMGLCPFHNEKTPSFSVSPQKGIFHCFGCGVGGTVINFVMKSEDMSFYEAVKYLAERANITLPQVDSRDVQKENLIKDQKEILYAINNEAAKFFYSYLSKPEGKVAVEYFKERHIDGNCAKNFWLGYSPNDKRKLYDHLLSLGYKENDILKAGVVSKKDDGTISDRFTNRVMFPIFNPYGKVAGFGARRIDNKKEFKYLNSPETLIYNKSRILYGIHIARKSRSKSVILVEGYMDVISLMKHGIYNVVAASGTSFTKEQAKLLKKYFEEVIVCLDSDDAGINAAKRAVVILREQDMKATVMNVTGAKDTDEFVNKYGKEKFEHLVSKRKSDILYLMQALGEKYNLDLSEDKVAFVSEMLPYISKIKNKVELDVAVGDLSKKTGVGTQAIYMQLGITGASIKTANDTGHEKLLPYMGAVTSDKLEKTRDMLMSVFLNEPTAYKRSKSVVFDGVFESEFHLKLLSYIEKKADEGQRVDSSELLQELGEEEVSEVTKLLTIDTMYESSDRAVVDFIKIIMNEKKKESVKELLQKGDLSSLNKLLNTNENRKEE